MSSVLAVPFRQWTTSLSFRPACRIRPALVVRHYSEDKAPSSADPDQDAPKDAPSSEPTPDSALEKAQAEAADLLGRLRYLQADFLNLQRNSAREREKTRDFAISNFASDLLETVDVLSLALKSVPQPVLTPPTSASTSADAAPPLSDSDAPVPEPPLNSPPTKTAEEYLRELYTGVEMTQRQLLQTLFKYHVKPFDPTGDTFDPNRHEALYQAPMPGKTPGTVIHCQKTGFTIRDRVLRAAQVGVVQESQS